MQVQGCCYAIVGQGETFLLPLSNTAAAPILESAPPLEVAWSQAEMRLPEAAVHQLRNEA